MSTQKDKKTKNVRFQIIKKTLINKLCVFLIVFISFMFFVFGIPIIINELYKLNTGYLTLWDAADVLAFYAVILSGIITIGALIVTIHFSKKDTEKQIKLSKAQTNTPFFAIEKAYQANINEGIYKSQNEPIWQEEYIINRYGDNQGQVVITLRNIGEGIAISPYYEINLLKNTNETVLPAFINKGDNLVLKYGLKNILEIKFGSSTFFSDFETFDSCLTLSYQNTLGIKFYQKIIFKHELNVERNSIFLIVNSISSQNIEL